MLQVGSGMSDAENRAHMGLWALLAAPLFVANDPSVMPERIRQVLTNQELIAVDQDPLGVPGFRLLSEGALEVWVRPLRAGELAVGFLNRGSDPLELQFDWSRYSIEEAIPGVWVRFAETPCSLRNLWSHSSEGDTRSPLSVTVAPHDLSLYRLRPVVGN
jgi:alpha-galactosidase